MSEGGFSGDGTFQEECGVTSPHQSSTHHTSHDITTSHDIQYWAHEDEWNTLPNTLVYLALLETVPAHQVMEGHRKNPFRRDLRQGPIPKAVG